jgi:hypothetical protein
MAKKRNNSARLRADLQSRLKVHGSLRDFEILNAGVLQSFIRFFFSPKVNWAGLISGPRGSGSGVSQQQDTHAGLDNAAFSGPDVDVSPYADIDPGQQLDFPTGTTPAHTPSSLKREPETTRSTSPPKRSRGRPTSATLPAVKDKATASDFDRGPNNPKAGRLYDPSSSSQRSQRHGAEGEQPRSSRPVSFGQDSTSEMILQPDTRPISHTQLVEEVKGIYAGLVMVESKCIEVDNAQSQHQNDPDYKLNNEQWQALIALHRTLLHEHHDFFLASQYDETAASVSFS